MKFNIKCSITVLLLIFPIVCLSDGFRFSLNHVDSKSSFTPIELINRAATRTRHGMSQLTSNQQFSSENISSTVQPEASTAEYSMDLAIGNPPLYFSAILDTGSDLIWTQCTPCKKCVSQPTPIYDPSKSTTVSSITCNGTLQNLCNSTGCNPMNCLILYNQTYGTGWTSGTLKQETFTFGTTELVPVSSILFGCSTSTSDNFNGSAGLVGFGRGSFSLPSQLNASMFSYCLTSFLDTNSTSTLFVGPMAELNGTAVKSTPFVKNPTMSPMRTFYYLSLKGISLGNTKLSIEPSAFTLQPNGTGGLFIDSGTVITRLVNEAYQAVKNAIDSTLELQRVNSSDIGLDLCYYLPSSSSPPSMPQMTFHFEGADMVLPVENYMIQFQDQTDNFWCLAMLPSESRSTLGNYQQQNFHILYNIEREVLSFSPVQCDKL